MAKIPKATKQQMDAMSVYGRLLDEARVRLQSIEDALNNHAGIPQPLIAEFGFLQLRMLCETVALCCLNAHGDMEETHTSKLQKAYEADKVIKSLEKLHPNFYPHPVTISSSVGSHHIERINDGFLRKDDLIRLYHECGDRLHRGSLSKFRSTAPRARHADHEKLREWLSKFIRLLQIHHVASHSNLAHFVCFLAHEEANGNARIILAQAPLPE